MHSVVLKQADIAEAWEPEAKAMMHRGSVSFYFAALLLPAAARRAIMFLYAWCRHCDDVIDGQDLGLGAVADRALVSVKGPVIEQLRSETVAAIRGARHAKSPVHESMGWVCRRHGIPEALPLELIAGMSMDVEGVKYTTINDLILYCYRVAGTVGEMFTHVVGVSNRCAFHHAADLGIAMQLTNIARDIMPDFAAGRVYLPSNWLNDAGLTPDNMTDPAHRAALFKVVQRLLAEADDHYKSGDEGLIYLPVQVALAVTTARLIYADIGARVLAGGSMELATRQVVPTYRKLWLATKALWLVAQSMKERLCKRT